MVTYSIFLKIFLIIFVTASSNHSLIIIIKELYHMYKSNASYLLYIDTRFLRNSSSLLYVFPNYS